MKKRQNKVEPVLIGTILASLGAIRAYNEQKEQVDLLTQTPEGEAILADMAVNINPNKTIPYSFWLSQLRDKIRSDISLERYRQLPYKAAKAIIRKPLIK